MPEQQFSSSRKRQGSERPQPNEISQPALEKQKLSHPSGSQPPAAFWDNLSEVWLTKRALTELDQRHRSKRNRQTAQDTAQDTAHYLRYCDSRTLRDVKLFARHGGPDLSDLRNVCAVKYFPAGVKADNDLYYPKPIHPSNHTMSLSKLSSQSQQRDLVNPPSTKPTITKTKSTGVYDRNFEQHLIDCSVYYDGYGYPNSSVVAEPNNWEDINQILAQPRPSLSSSQFSNKDFKEFKWANAHARKEKQVSELVLPTIEGQIPDALCRSGGIPFTNMDPLTDGTLKPGNPDIYYGARPKQLARKVRDELGGQITPSTQHDLPIVPNFFLEAKGPDGSAAVAGRQACYNGALGARGMHSLQSCGKDEPVFDNNAYTITSIYHSGQLKMYTSHPAQPSQPEGRPEYHITQLRSFAMTDTAKTFRQGAGAYRNLRDWSKVQRDKAIQQANERANPVEAEAPALASDPTGDAAGDALGASPASSFVTAVSDTEAYTMSQESRTSLKKGDFEESDGSIQDSAEHRVPAKRSRRQQPHGKRRNTDSSAEESDGSAVVPGGLGRKRRRGIAGCADSIPQA